jgi:hypothetical protein
VIVFQDFLTKFPRVFPIPDQKTARIVRLLVEEVMPLFGVPEALLSDRGTNLLSHLMKDVCAMLGTNKLNTTAAECDGMVECFNRTLKISSKIWRAMGSLSVWHFVGIPKYSPRIYHGKAIIPSIWN